MSGCFACISHALESRLTPYYHFASGRQGRKARQPRDERNHAAQLLPRYRVYRRRRSLIILWPTSARHRCEPRQATKQPLMPCSPGLSINRKLLRARDVSSISPGPAAERWVEIQSKPSMIRQPPHEYSRVFQPGIELLVRDSLRREQLGQVRVVIVS